MSPAPDPRLIREACHLALDVAFDGERADPRVPAPPRLRQMFGFRKLSRTSIATIQKAVDLDDAFRERVAARATEEAVGRAGYLWLTRPDGWADDPVWDDDHREAADPVVLSKLRRERDGAEAKAERLRLAAEESEAARRRAADQLDEVRREVQQAEREREEALGQVAALADERARAVRSLKDVEAELATARRDLRVARDATREAEAERLALQLRVDALEAGASAPGPFPDAHATAGRQGSLGDPVRERVSRAVEIASGAASDLVRALEEAAAALDAPDGMDGVEEGSGPDRSAPEAEADSRQGRRTGRRRRVRRRAGVPPGLIEGSPEADRHLVGAGDVLLLVDGYNLARECWTGVAPEEERRRVVQILEEVQARSGAQVVVVFDGVTGEVSPVASRSIAVRYSPTGVTADEMIADTLGSLSDDEAVIVVSSDREVADDARRQGATVLRSSAFLAAIGR